MEALSIPYWKQPRNQTLTIKVGQSVLEFHKENVTDNDRVPGLRYVEFGLWLAERGLTLDQCKEMLTTHNKLEKTLDYVIETVQPHLSLNLAGVAQDYYKTL
jgi:hypothetical protein